MKKFLFPKNRNGFKINSRIILSLCFFNLIYLTELSAQFSMETTPFNFNTPEVIAESNTTGLILICDMEQYNYGLYDVSLNNFTKYFRSSQIHFDGNIKASFSNSGNRLILGSTDNITSTPIVSIYDKQLDSLWSVGFPFKKSSFKEIGFTSDDNIFWIITNKNELAIYNIVLGKINYVNFIDPYYWIIEKDILVTADLKLNSTRKIDLLNDKQEYLTLVKSNSKNHIANGLLPQFLKHFNDSTGIEYMTAEGFKIISDTIVVFPFATFEGEILSAVFNEGYSVFHVNNYFNEKQSNILYLYNEKGIQLSKKKYNNENSFLSLNKSILKSGMDLFDISNGKISNKPFKKLSLAESAYELPINESFFTISKKDYYSRTLYIGKTKKKIKLTNQEYTFLPISNSKSDFLRISNNNKNIKLSYLTPSKTNNELELNTLSFSTKELNNFINSIESIILSRNKKYLTIGNGFEFIQFDLSTGNSIWKATCDLNYSNFFDEKYALMMKDTAIEIWSIDKKIITGKLPIVYNTDIKNNFVAAYESDALGGTLNIFSLPNGQALIQYPVNYKYIEKIQLEYEVVYVLTKDTLFVHSANDLTLLEKFYYDQSQKIDVINLIPLHQVLKTYNSDLKNLVVTSNAGINIIKSPEELNFSNQLDSYKFKICDGEVYSLTDNGSINWNIYDLMKNYTYTWNLGLNDNGVSFTIRKSDSIYYNKLSIEAYKKTHKINHTIPNFKYYTISYYPGVKVINLFDENEASINYILLLKNNPDTIFSSNQITQNENSIGFENDSIIYKCNLITGKIYIQCKKDNYLNQMIGKNYFNYYTINGKWGLQNPITGESIIKPEFENFVIDSTEKCFEILAVNSNNESIKYSIPINGQPFVTPYYIHSDYKRGTENFYIVSEFKDRELNMPYYNFDITENKHPKIGLISTNGKLIIPVSNCFIEPLNDQLLLAYSFRFFEFNENYYKKPFITVYNQNWKVILNISDSIVRVEDLGENYIAVEKVKNKLLVYIIYDYNGKIISEMEFETVYPFSGNYMVGTIKDTAYYHSKVIVMNKIGEFQEVCILGKDEAESARMIYNNVLKYNTGQYAFSNGVNDQKNWLYDLKKKKTILDYPISAVEKFEFHTNDNSKEYLKIMVRTNYGMKAGLLELPKYQTIFQCKYDEIIPTSTDTVILVLNNLIGFGKLNGEIISNCIHPINPSYFKEIYSLNEITFYYNDKEFKMSVTDIIQRKYEN